VLLATPEYFKLVVLLGPIYDSFGHYSLIQVLATAPGGPLSLIAVLAGLALWRRVGHPVLTSTVAVGLVAAYLAGAAQHKGWTYHFLPARVLAVLLLGLVVADVSRPLIRPVERVYAAVAFTALVTTLGWALGQEAFRATGLDAKRQWQQAQLGRDLAAVRRHVAPGESLYAFSYTINSGFPLVNYSGLRWASRFPHLWLLEALYHDQLQAVSPMRYRRAADMGPAERYLNDAVAEDLDRNRPDLIMVLRNARDVPENAVRRMDYLAYFGRDPRIAAELASYRFVEDYGPYRIYLRARAPEQPGTPPRSQPGRLDIRRSTRSTGFDAAFFLSLGVFLVIGVLAYGVEVRRR
jgi:hypothetical protein